MNSEEVWCRFATVLKISRRDTLLIRSSLLPILFLILPWQDKKNTFVSSIKRQRCNLPLRYHSCSGKFRHSYALYRALTGTAYSFFGVLLRGDMGELLLNCLAPSGSSLKAVLSAHASSSKRYGMKFSGEWGRSSGQTADSGWRTCWWWSR